MECENQRMLQCIRTQKKDDDGGGLGGRAAMEEARKETREVVEG